MRQILAVMLVGGSVGCLDHTIVELPSEDPSTDKEVGDFEQVNPLIADVCDRRTWEIQPDASQLDIAVVDTALGATVLSVPTEGGVVRGFRVDDRGETDRTVVALREDRNYERMTASMVDNRLVVASVDKTSIALDIVRDDLGAVHRLGEFPGTLATPVVGAFDSRAAFFGGEAGVTAELFDGPLWDRTGPIQITGEPVTALSTAVSTAPEDILVAWSTESGECHLRRMLSSNHSITGFRCDNVRMAVHPSGKEGLLVFEDDGFVYRSGIAYGGQEIGSKLPIAEQARAPRVVFDGARYWVSYLAAHGEVVVGFLDNGRLHSRALEGLAPANADAYDLAVFADGVWVVGLTDTAFDAQRVCARSPIVAQ